MFKRIEKRKRRKEEEEQLGIDEDMKDILGLHDAESDESDSDSDRSFGEEGIDEEVEAEDGDIIHETDDEEDNEKESNGGLEDEDPSITTQVALRDPIYLVSVQPELKACIVCPGKLFKGVKMIDLHKHSNACTAHNRRVKQFVILAKDAGPNESAWDVLKRGSEDKPKLSLTVPIDSSKRAEKRRAQALRRKEKRRQAKAKAKMKKVAGVVRSSSILSDASSKPSSKPPHTNPPKRKKQKLETTGESLKLGETVLNLPASPPTSKKSASSKAEPAEGSKVAAVVKSIAKSASDRAKLARSRITSVSKPSKNTSGKFPQKKVMS